MWEDGEFLLRRTRLDIDGERREVLTLLPAAEHPTPATLDRFAHEYALKDELDVAWAARPLALRRDGGHSILVREDPGGDLLETLLDRPTKLGLGVSLRIALGLAEAVAGLHRRGLIHKDIKPTHVLVDPDSGAVRLTGFGLASRLPREQPAVVPPEMIAGTLAYMAPEQTGRMNRSVDARSDLYAVGVTLYRMFTGSLPFSASEPMEWVHCQIARSPAPPAERAPGVPPALSAMVMKLLAKAAEERYQTAAGLAADLRRCLSEWEAAGSIASFAPGALDFPDRLRIPEKLYGREGEVDRLLAAFERVVASGALELVLVSGYSGIGKSSVVNELHKALAPRRGLFASGKFDQSRTDVPYATLAQAVQILVRHILGESDAAIGRWRAALEEALGPNGRLMIDLVPQLKLVIGEPPPVPELPSQEAQRRFHLVVRRLLGVFARAEHPLVLFLDDLQWLDPATLDLLEDLLTQPELGHLLLIGAYRNNEVDAAHPLRRTLAAIGQAGARVHHITLAPLARDDLEQMVSDALRCDPAHSAPLADLVHAKTAGNPFFVIQFLSALAEEDLLRFEHGAARWGWDLARIEAKGYTDNVVELLVGRLHRLPLATRIALRQLACLGNHGSLRMLALVLGTVEAQVRADLWEAVRQELVLLLDGGCKFVHDRVQEAAYSLVPEASRAAEHLRIGRLLAAHTEPERRQEAIFEIVSQLNRGAALITEPGERVRLAELNLHAGQRAKASTAYATALAYLTTGAALLAKDRWSRQHELSFALELNRAECELLTGALKEAEERLAALVARAADTVEQATVAGLRIDLYMTLDRTGHAIEVGLDYLRLLGIEWSPHPTDEEARREYERIWLQLDGREIEELIDFPLMRDPALLATLDVLIKVATVAFFTDLNLHSLAPCRVVNLSLERGNCDASCVAYVQLGLIAGSRFGDYEGAYRFGRLSYDLVEKRGLKRFQARTYNNYAVHVLPFAHHLKVAREPLRRSYEAANRNGDLTFAAYSSGNLNVNLLAAGEPLAEVEREAERGLTLTRKMRFGLGADIIMSQLQLVRTLRGSTQKFGSFDDAQFDELQVESRFACNPDLQLAECWYWIRKVEARFLAGDYASAVAAVAAAQQLPWASLATLDGVKYHFYGALCRAAFHDSASPDEQRRNLGLLADHHRQLKVWAQRCPENFETRAALVGAEIARIEGRVLDAEHSYEQAIRSARANGFVHCEAVAYELAARFYKGRGFEEIARLYLQNARDGYLRWGADGKVRQLEDANPQIADEGPLPGPTSTILTPVGRLDLATVIRVSQALSAEIVLEKLLDTLMRTAIEQAGADRGLLILRSGAEQRIAVEARTSGESVIVDKSGETVTSAKLPDSVLRFVMRTHESVILDEAVGENEFAADPYIRRQQPLSILCLPLINQGRIIGILYLENKLASHVFAPGRVLTLNLLASQAAISLENSRLYHDLEEREARIRRLVDANIIGIFFWEFEGRILEANDAFLKIIGYDRDDLEAGALRWTDLTPPDWRERDEQWVREHKATGLRPPIEKEYFRKDGSRAPILLAAATFDNSATEGVGFVVDLTERKRAEEALRQREAAIRGLADSNLLGIVAWEFPDTRIIEANDAFLRMVGYAREDLVANRLTLVDMTPAEWKSRAIQNVSVLERGQIAQPYEKEYLRKDGTRACVISFGTLFDDGDTGAKRGVSFAIDLTERKRAEEALRIAQTELAHAARLTTLGELAASIAHEINQPLAGISSNGAAGLNWLNRKTPDLDQARDAFSRILRDSARASDVIRGLRALAKKSGPQLAKLDIDDLIRDVLALTGGELRRHGVVLRTDLAAGSRPILGDRVQLQQVLLNLIMNGIEAMRGVSERTRDLLVSSSLVDPGSVLVAVEDTGAGLDPAVAERLFEPFFTTKSEGLGMGLSICRSIVEGHRGRLWASPREPHGAAVRFTLPVEPAH